MIFFFIPYFSLPCTILRESLADGWRQLYDNYFTLKFGRLFSIKVYLIIRQNAVFSFSQFLLSSENGKDDDDDGNDQEEIDTY